MIPKILNLSIPGRPPTKKNSRQAGWHGKITKPSKAYQEYYDFCIGDKRRPGWLVQWGNFQFTGPVRVDCHYWMPDYKSWPDLTGLLQATGDILQAAGIIKNDKQVVTWGTSMIMDVDPKNPRVEIAIMDHPVKWWRW